MSKAKTSIVSPVASASDVITMYSTSGAERTLAAAGAYERSDVIIACAEERTLTLFLAYDAAAIGGYPVIIPLGSCAATQPAAGDDSWFMLPTSDGTFTATVYTGALPSGSDFTLAPGLGQVEVRGLAIKPTAAMAATTDEVRIAITIDVRALRYFQFLIAEVGITATPGAALVTASVSV